MLYQMRQYNVGLRPKENFFCAAEKASIQRVENKVIESELRPNADVSRGGDLG